MKSGKKSEQSGHFAWFDSLRFISALAVVIHHSRALCIAPYLDLPSTQKNIFSQIFYFLTRLGQEAVIIFFVMSGYFVMGRAIQRFQQGKFSLQDYALDRAVRIYLPFLPILILSFGLQQYLRGEGTVGSFFGHLVGLQGGCGWGNPGSLGGPVGINGALWSLAYEIWLYAGLGAVLWFCQKKSPAALICILISAGVLMNYNSLLISAWVAGGIGYFLSLKLSLRSGLILIATMAASVLGVEWCRGASAVSILWESQLLWIPLIFTCVVLVSAIPNLKSRSEFIQKTDKHIGAMACFSYTLYLVHMPVLQWLELIWPMRCGSFSCMFFFVFLVKIGVCLIIAYMLYWIFERNTAAVKNLIRKMMVSRSPRT